jgi:hypothetical protein
MPVFTVSSQMAAQCFPVAVGGVVKVRKELGNKMYQRPQSLLLPVRPGNPGHIATRGVR